MSRRTRRHVLGCLSSLTLACMSTHRAWTQTPSRVVVVGGDFGAATCAKYLRRTDPSLEVTKVAGLQRVLDRYHARPILTAQQIEDVIAYLWTLTEELLPTQRLA